MNFFSIFKNSNIYLQTSDLSFFQLFSDFPLKNGAIFDCFSVIFICFLIFSLPLIIRFSDAEIPIVYWQDEQRGFLLQIFGQKGRKSFA